MSTCTRPICKNGCMIPQDCPEDEPPSAEGPSEIAAHSGAFPLATGSVAGEKLTQRQFENLQACMSNKRRLAKLTPHELIAEALASDAADYDVTVELMDRVLPGWSDAPDGTYDKPQNNKMSNSGA